MTKFLLILAALASLVGIFFGYQNRTTFVETRNAKDKENAETTKVIAETQAVNDSINIVFEDLRGMEDERDEAKELLDGSNRKLSQTKSSLTVEQTKLTALQEEYAKYEEEIAKLPPGISVETLSEDIARLNQTVTDKEGEIVSLEGEIAVVEDSIDQAERRLTAHRLTQTEREERFSTNSIQATVTAVNREWGFVVVNAGAQDGIAPDSSLLVMRDSEPVSKLRIISLEADTVIADIDDATVTGRVIPGDSVILEQPNES